MLGEVFTMNKPSGYAVALIEKMRKGKKPGATPDEEPAEEESEDAPIAPTAEAAAFKKLRMAIASEDDVKGAAAFKQFLAACGAIEGDE